MAKTKVVSVLLLALIAMSMVATEVMAANRYGPGSVKPARK